MRPDAYVTRMLTKPNEAITTLAFDDVLPPTSPFSRSALISPLIFLSERSHSCNAGPIIDVRCPEYDLCSPRMARIVHDPSHAMLCVRDPADPDKLQDGVAEGEGNSIILGLKVYTMKTT
ncbi:hypothetical protein RSOLAG22IIIB_07093 [Rhizoctonia solani]|uniref:Uncharacterized protein n=1 Tax=Rhizoctonia solani TaxID=456999 RepID=A0A0K6GIQ7_9AGAM|nr:hypothetical protein RSOLAG22IIIB_07093 [Rhizoctonia solani]